MLYLNFQNVEELIFHDRTVQGMLPTHMFSLFEQWRLAKQLPMLRSMGKQSLLDFLNGLTDDDVDILEDYFDEKIVVEKLNYSVVKSLKIPLKESNICHDLCEILGFGYFSTWRDAEHLYVTFWR